ncbi:hypothetical protein CD934_30490 [Streptomyces calvus]|uniref:Transposase IS4 N-terminal domain-containing protein n=1 Tax=Streptomyces calvus TaxID=67282 RepID=A0A514JYR1_9ACTN|nr:hypothetical protein CD934_30490 [Streptomyces calvus]
MPRAGQSRKAPDDSLTDRISVGLILRTFPPHLVDAVVASCGRTEHRQRLLPSRTTVYFVLAICLFTQESYARVAELLADGSLWAGAEHAAGRPPTTAAISRARARLGPEPLAGLFAEVTRSSLARTAPGDRYGRWRVVSADAAAVAVPESEENRSCYGLRPAVVPAQGRFSNSTRGALPRVHVLALGDRSSLAVRHAVLERPPDHSPGFLAQELCAVLGPGSLPRNCALSWARVTCCWPATNSTIPSHWQPPAPRARTCSGRRVPVHPCTPMPCSPTAPASASWPVRPAPSG